MMKNKKTSLIIFVVAVLALGIGLDIYQMKSRVASFPDAKNATYVIEGKNQTLVNGRAEEELAPGSASRIITQYFGNEVVGDFNRDGQKDVAFLLSQQTGGSGTFYYVAVALGQKKGVRGTNAIFLGDRIAPQSTVFQNGEIVVNYADRKLGEPMSTNPSMGVSKYFTVVDESLFDVKK